jgi:hypothetical protein
VIRAWEAAIAVEVTRAEAVCAIVAYAQEAATVKERGETSIREAGAWVVLVETEAQDRVLRTEAESAASLDFIHGEANKFARKVARDMTEVNF